MRRFFQLTSVFVVTFAASAAPQTYCGNLNVEALGNDHTEKQYSIETKPKKGQPAMKTVLDVSTGSAGCNGEIKTLRKAVIANLAMYKGYCFVGEVVNGSLQFSDFFEKNSERYHAVFKGEHTKE